MAFERRRNLAVALIPALIVTQALPAYAADPEACQTVRLAEPGWNDLAFTTGTAQVVLGALGYEVKADLLGLPIIYESLKTKELDAFLGYWDPAMITYAKPYLDDGSVTNLGINLQGAKYTFAVPDYVAAAGVKDFSDLAAHADAFDRKMYGIEPGSNQLMLDVIADPAFGLDGWEVIESSETGMLTEVKRKVDRNQFIVFQGWAPHPMNTAFNMVYLTGGDAHYGPDFGAATVSSQIRSGYQTECPNVAALLKNMVFSVEFESQGMGYLINDGLSPVDAANQILKEQPQILEGWLAGITTFDGKPGLDAVQAALGL